MSLNIAADKDTLKSLFPMWLIDDEAVCHLFPPY